FVDLPEAPVPSLLRGFSAPVRLHAPYDRDELMFLLSHDSDGFVRWEAGQRLALQVIDEQLQARQAGRELALDPRLPQAWESLLRASLDNPRLDKAMIAHLIQ